MNESPLYLYQCLTLPFETKIGALLYLRLPYRRMLKGGFGRIDCTDYSLLHDVATPSVLPTDGLMAGTIA